MKLIEHVLKIRGLIQQAVEIALRDLALPKTSLLPTRWRWMATTTRRDWKP